MVRPEASKAEIHAEVSLTVGALSVRKCEWLRRRYTINGDFWLHLTEHPRRLMTPFGIGSCSSGGGGVQAAECRDGARSVSRAVRCAITQRGAHGHCQPIEGHARCSDHDDDDVRVSSQSTLATGSIAVSTDWRSRSWHRRPQRWRS